MIAHASVQASYTFRLEVNDCRVPHLHPVISFFIQLLIRPPVYRMCIKLSLLKYEVGRVPVPTVKFVTHGLTKSFFGNSNATLTIEGV